MARQTFTELQTTTKDYISQASGSVASSTIANFIIEHINKRYHFIQRKLRGYIMEDLAQTASTVASQQIYHYPPQVYPPIDAASIEVSSVDYPLDIVSSRREWDRLNQIDFSGTTIPQYIFPMRDHFEVWPIPQAAGYTITLTCSMLDRDMSAEDYTTGTIKVTNNSAAIVGTGTTFTNRMAGRWLKTDNDPTFHRIDSFTDTTNITLESVWEGLTATTQSYTIGEVPEIPPELHEIIPHGVAADFFAGPRKDFQAAQAHNNYFWTGDYMNANRHPRLVQGGLISAIQRYSRRGDAKVINKGKKRWNRFDERWSATLS